MAHVATGSLACPNQHSGREDESIRFVSVAPSGLGSACEGSPRLAPWAAFLRRFAAGSGFPCSWAGDENRPGESTGPTRSVTISAYVATGESPVQASLRVYKI